MADQLDPQQQTAYNQFVDITGLQESEALSLLRRFNWDVGSAVQGHFEGVDSVPVSSSTPRTSAAPPAVAAASSTSSSPHTFSLPDIDQLQPEVHDIAPTINPNIPVYVPRRPGGGPSGITAGSLIQTIIFAPFNIGAKLFNTVMYFLSWIFPFFPRLTGYYPANRSALYTGTDTGRNHPKNAAARLIRSFEENYGLISESEGGADLSSDHSVASTSGASGATTSVTNSGSSNMSSSPRLKVPFFEGGYTDALQTAKDNLKYLVVVLLSEEHDLTRTFNKTVLLNPNVLALLNRDDVLFWAGDVCESEAYQVANGLNATQFPFCALIGPSPRTLTSRTLVMEVLLRISGRSTTSNPAEFISTIEDCMESHRPKLMSLVLDRQERDVSRQLREEQDSAYERSLAADREREERRRQEEEQRKREEEARLRQIQARELALQQKAQWKLWRAQQLKRKLDGQQQESNNQNTLKMARISIRLLSGERVVQKFNAVDTIEDIYAFVECYDVLRSLDPNSPSHHDKPEGYAHDYGFELVSPMPRKVLHADDRSIDTEPSVWPNGSLVVEQDDDDDDE